MGEGRREVPGGFAVGAQPGSLPGGDRGEVADGLGGAGLAGMVQQLGRRHVAAGAQHVERPGVETAAGHRRQRGLDGPAGELVAEGERVGAGGLEESDGDAFLASGGSLGAALDLEQGCHRAAREDRGAVEELAAGGGETVGAGEHRVLNARRNVRRPVGADQLGHEERVPGGGAEERGAVHARDARELRHRRFAQRFQRDARHPVGWHGGEGPPQPGAALDGLVAAGNHEQDVAVGHPAAKETDEVQRGVIGPVQNPR